MASQGTGYITLQTGEMINRATIPFRGSSESFIHSISLDVPVYRPTLDVHLRRESLPVEVARYQPMILCREEDWNCTNPGCDPNVNIPDGGLCEHCHSPEH